MIIDNVRLWYMDVTGTGKDDGVSGINCLECRPGQALADCLYLYVTSVLLVVTAFVFFDFVFELRLQYFFSF